MRAPLYYFGARLSVLRCAYNILLHATANAVAFDSFAVKYILDFVGQADRLLAAAREQIVSRQEKEIM